MLYIVFRSTLPFSVSYLWKWKVLPSFLLLRANISSGFERSWNSIASFLLLLWVTSDWPTLLEEKSFHLASLIHLTYFKLNWHILFKRSGGYTLLLLNFDYFYILCFNATFISIPQTLSKQHEPEIKNKLMTRFFIYGSCSVRYIKKDEINFLKWPNIDYNDNASQDIQTLKIYKDALFLLQLPPKTINCFFSFFFFFYDIIKLVFHPFFSFLFPFSIFILKLSLSSFRLSKWNMKYL